MLALAQAQHAAVHFSLCAMLGTGLLIVDADDAVGADGAEGADKATGVDKIASEAIAMMNFVGPDDAQNMSP